MSDTPRDERRGDRGPRALPVVGRESGPGSGSDTDGPTSTSAGPSPEHARDRARAHVRALADGSRDLDRRAALKLMAAAVALPAVGACGPDETGDGQTTAGGTGGAATAGTDAAPDASDAPSGANPLARGDAWDPDLLDPTVPWSGVLSDDELASLAVLCDVIIPADERSPSASAVGAHEYIDEWVSAPYDGYRNDRVLVRGGLVWLDAESARRFGEGRRFRDLDDAGRQAICDDICDAASAAPEHAHAARFFAKVRDLTAGAFYTTDEGMADIAYVGNVPVHGDWPAPPDEAFRHLGMDPA